MDLAAAIYKSRIYLILNYTVVFFITWIKLLSSNHLHQGPTLNVIDIGVLILIFLN